MKIAISLLFSVVAVNAGAGQSTQSAQHTPPPFSITIRALQDVVKAGSEVLVEVTLKNTSAQEISFDVTGRIATGRIAYLVDVRDVHENMVSNTERARKLREQEEQGGDG